jgi:hypothetical protein
MADTKAHTRYYLNTGDSIPGVTTVLGVMAKPALIAWANRLGLQGIDSTKYKDKMANIGTLAHYFVMCHFTGKTPDTSEFSQSDIDTAHNCMKSFYSWEKQHKIEPIIVEIPLVSDVYGYGGTPDLVARVDGELELIDFKSGSGIYYDYYYQVAAYRQILKEHGHKVERARLIRIGRDDNEGFEERLILKFDQEFELFLHCLSIYNLLKSMKRSL